MRLPRMTTRRWMVVVVVVGVLMGGVHVKRRSDAFLRRAELHNRMAAAMIAKHLAALDDPAPRRLLGLSRVAGPQVLVCDPLPLARRRA